MFVFCKKKILIYLEICCLYILLKLFFSYGFAIFLCGGIYILFNWPYPSLPHIHLDISIPGPSVKSHIFSIVILDWNRGCSTLWFSILLFFVKIVFLKDFKSVEEEKPKQSKDSEELLIDECNSFHSQEVNYAFYATVLFQFHFLCSRYMHTTFQIWKILATIKFLFLKFFLLYILYEEKKSFYHTTYIKETFYLFVFGIINININWY